MKGATGSLKKVIELFGGKRSALIAARFAEDLVPIVTQTTRWGKIDYFCAGEVPEMRARTMLTKEPGTIEWIDTFDTEDVFWDVGANVGVYSLYAALRNIRCLSFEPSPGNFYLLSRNVEINRMDNRISALCVAFNDATRLDSFYMASTELGGALNSFAESVDWRGQPFTASFKQAMIGFSIDEFVHKFSPPFPNHIKIDVDGIEGKIIRGAKLTLADTRLKSILVELDSGRDSYCREVVRDIEEAGMKLVKKDRAAAVEDSSYSACCNHVFYRTRE